LLRGPLASPGFRGQFSGHETFPLRYGWLNKVFDAIADGKSKRNENLFSRDQAVANFGVGKNMVSSMKHWALVAGIIEEVESGYRATQLGELLMGDEGLDPYLESPASLWLIHWHIASNLHRATTWYWAFGCYSGLIFDQDRLVSELSQLFKDQRWKHVAPTTVKRDVECFIKTYAMHTRSRQTQMRRNTAASLSYLILRLAGKKLRGMGSPSNIRSAYRASTTT
jgi:hypothetical protein